MGLLTCTSYYSLVGNFHWKKVWERSVLRLDETGFLDSPRTLEKPLRVSTLVWSDRLSHAFTHNLGSTQQTTYTMSCLVSRLVDLYNFLICAH
jgi:hypothetical protein